MKHKQKATKHEPAHVPATPEEVLPAAVNEQEPERAKKPATEPWLPENASDSARRKGLLGISRDKKGFELRWVRADAVDRRKAQGYVLATPAEFDATADENGMIRRNELVLMVVRKDIYDSRREDVRKQTELQKKSAKREFLRERGAAERQLGHTLAVRGEDREEE